MSVLTAPPIALAPETRILTGPAGSVRVSPAEVRMLVPLMSAPGRLVRHTGSKGSERVVVYRLRAVLRQIGAPGLIQTVFGAGYVLGEATVLLTRNA